MFHQEAFVDSIARIKCVCTNSDNPLALVPESPKGYRDCLLSQQTSQFCRVTLNSSLWFVLFTRLFFILFKWFEFVWPSLQFQVSPVVVACASNILFLKVSGNNTFAEKSLCYENLFNIVNPTCLFVKLNGVSLTDSKLFLANLGTHCAYWITTYCWTWYLEVQH